MIVYASFTLRLHGLHIMTRAELARVQAEIKKAVRTVVPEPIGGSLDGDVELELDETAGYAP